MVQKQYLKENPNTLGAAIQTIRKFRPNLLHGPSLMLLIKMIRTDRKKYELLKRSVKTFDNNELPR